MDLRAKQGLKAGVESAATSSEPSPDAGIGLRNQGCAPTHAMLAPGLKVVCQFCACGTDGEKSEQPAVAFAPQRLQDGDPITWQPVCQDCAETWFDESDPANPSNGFAFVPILGGGPVAKPEAAGRTLATLENEDDRAALRRAMDQIYNASYRLKVWADQHPDPESRKDLHEDAVNIGAGALWVKQDYLGDEI